MLHKVKNRKQEGFTIIEVLIVLAIAGLILLIVFLAVPALQRSSRNTQRKNDVGALATGVSNYISNNQGALPSSASISATGNQVTLSGAAGTSSNADVKFGYYTVAPTVVACGTTSGTTACTGATYGSAKHQNFLAKLLVPKAYAAAPPPAAPAIGPDQVAILTGATCVGNQANGAGSRSYAIIYELEQSGSTTTTGGVKQCQGS